MWKNPYILVIIILSVILVIYTGVLTYLIVKLINQNKASGFQRITKNEQLRANNYNTEFFRDSAKHAEEVLSGKMFIQEYGQPDYFGNKLIDIVLKLNPQTKNNIKLAINYMMMEPVQARSNEQNFRMISEQEKVPLWFVILRDAVKKMVPEFFIQQENNAESKIISIHTKVA